MLEIELAGYEVLSFLLDEFTSRPPTPVPGIDAKFDKLLKPCYRTHCPPKRWRPIERLWCA